MIRQPIVTVAGHVDHGKCVSGDTLIPLIDGTIITAKELFEHNFDKNKAEKIDDGVLQNIEDKEINVFSFDGKNIINKKISHIWKRKADKLIEIKTSSGDIIKTTPEHPFFTFSLEKLRGKKASDLREGEYITIPKKISTEETDIKSIIIEKLRRLNNFTCFLNENSTELVNKIKAMGVENIERKLKIKNVRDSIKKLRLRIKDLFMIGDLLKISEINIYSMIKSIKNANEGWRVGHTSKTISLPNLNKLEEFGYILGSLAGDGHISKRAILNNNDKEVQDSYMLHLNEIFNLNSEVKQGHTCQIIFDDGGLTFSRFLTEIVGFPKKNKSAEIFVPDIAKRNKEIFKGFFAGLFDTDGYVSHLNNSIEITSKSKRLIKECSILLLNVGIHSAVYEKNGFYVLRIANKIYLEKFLQNFKPRLKRKFERVVNSYAKAQTSRIFDFLPVEGDILKKLIVVGKINKKVPYFNKYAKVGTLSVTFLDNALTNIKQENEISLILKKLLMKEVSFVKVISKKEIFNEEGFVYDFTVPETHNFIAERVLVHNTSLLDRIRGSSVAEKEAGRITQKISFTLFPAENIKKGCYILDKYNIALQIPGFLFIDTPGHAAFTNLRKRGGSLADLAILVIDINEGIKPQTAEVIQILKANKTPFIISLNKIDAISGWRKQDDELRESIEKQAIHAKENFEEKLYTIISALHSHGFEADLFYNVKDFRKKLALVPCSAKTGEGIPELLMMLCGLSQKFLKERLSLAKDAKGIILEIKKEKTMQYIEAILYDGELAKGDEIAIATFTKPIVAKIRSMQEVLPVSAKFKIVSEAKAATGLRMQLTEKVEVLPGMPFQIYKGNLDKIEKEFKKELSETIKLDRQGIIIKADSLGSLEAMMKLLRQEKIEIAKAGIGSINKNDIAAAMANLETNSLNAIILCFNVEIDEEAKEVMKKATAKKTKQVKILINDVIYRLIEDLKKWQQAKAEEIEKEKLLNLASVFKLAILHNFVFNNAKPAIFGVRVLAGKLNSNVELIDEEDEKIGKIKNVQSEGKSVEQAGQGKEVAISVPGITFDRQLKNKDFLFSDINEFQFREFKKNKELLSSSEIACLQEIANIKRKTKATWGI